LIRRRDLGALFFQPLAQIGVGERRHDRLVINLPPAVRAFLQALKPDIELPRS
jgi:hypothetical protein